MLEVDAAERRRRTPGATGFRPSTWASWSTPSDPAHLAPLARMIAGVGRRARGGRPRRTGPARACPTRATAPTSATVRAASTGPPSRRRSSTRGSRRCRASRRSSRRAGASPTSAAGHGLVRDRGREGASRRRDVWGLDNDAASIEDARAHAAAAGVKGALRVRRRARARGATAPSTRCCCSRCCTTSPVRSRCWPRRATALAADGVVLVADELVAPAFTAPGDDLERMMYGWSIVHCLPTQMAEQPSAAIGTVIRERHGPRARREGGLLELARRSRSTAASSASTRLER